MTRRRPAFLPGDRRRSRGATWLAVSLLGMTVVSPAVWAGPAVSPDWLSARVAACDACHGKEGVAERPMFPILAGQPESYLVHALTAYRDGRRDNAIMAAQVRGLSDAEVRALAAYYHRQSSPLTRTP